ncbi:L,D-transpeptidase family protein [Fusobacterium mortiferum]|uniref:L,D-transpeptidase family protein n=1 Tax=Fusobacterium mortiferum TaxID=850 RepID=UPI0022E3DDAB|nr:SH3 domain-containing protein [Fusobacterium mortiferum]MDD7261969.1 L,D-transpeptidase family protein [Fusobacterium mortiferum]MDY5980560.1 L,D-transpeptidase family protein [Fusobacterium mortiferum]
MKIFKIFILQIVIGIIAMAYSGQSDWSTMAVYDNKIPENIAVNEKYGEHPEVLDYVFVRARTANMRELPSTSGKIIGKYPYDTKLIALEKVLNYGNLWFYVEDSKGNRGYVSANVVRKRTFRFQKAMDKIVELENFMKEQRALGREIASTNSYIPNPNNQNFKREKDKYGTTLDQSSIGTSVINGEEIYIPDRSILSVIEKGKTTSRVKVANIPEELIVPNSSISRNPKIQNEFFKVIAIDVSNQNMIVFEKNSEGIWEVISYVYSKTGIESKLGFETPKGFFISPMAKYIMPYNSEIGEKEGYARFAIRFSGGGYLHGTPINYDEEINKEFFMKQKERTLGTFTGTRKCIRTTEEHAKFLFDWIVSKPNKKYNEQRPDKNVMFVIF